MSGNTNSAIAVRHIVGSDGFAGIERHAFRLVRDLRELGCAAELACPLSASDLRTEARAHGVPVVPVLGGFRPGRQAIIHVHDGRSAMVGLLLAGAGRTCFVRTQHFVRPASVTRTGWRRSASVTLQRAVNRRLSGYIAVSETAAAAAQAREETGRGTLAVIPPGVELPDSHVVAKGKEARLQSRDPVVASIGRLEPERRFGVLLEAIAYVRSAEPTCHFVIAGSGSLEAELKRRASVLGVDDMITWTGWVRDVQAVLLRSHLYVNTLPFEGFGMATAEAMGFALPVIATSSGASTELVEDGTTGYLVPPEDADALAEAICKLVSNRRRAAAMGDAGRVRALTQFSAFQTAVSTLAFYERLLGRAGAP